MKLLPSDASTILDMLLFRKKLVSAKSGLTLTDLVGLPSSVVMRILDLAPVGILVAPLQEGEPLIYVNKAFERITGYSAADVLGKNCRYLQGSDRMQPQIAELRAGISRRDEISVTLRNYRRNGQLFWNELCLAPAGHGSAGPTHYIGLMHDVTSSKETAERLHQTLETDRLTGILNRYAFYDRVVRLASDPSVILLVIKIDIAYFHDINTGFGYEVGDNVLRQIADRLIGVSPAAAGRLNAGEFGIACQLASRDDADAALAKVLAALAPRYVVPGAVVSVRFAVGYTVGEPGADALTLIRRAGAALKESRLTKLREVRRFDEAAEARSRDRIRLTNDLQQALIHEEFSFAYQPKVVLATGIPVGAEALLRWNHGLFGEQRPDRFINVAEDTGIILDIGAWGLRNVAAYASRINRDRIQPLTFAVNVSTVEFIHRNMVRFTADVLDKSGVDPRWLIFELTESLMAESSPKMLQIFESLRSLGVGLAIDDFGTGYASLRYLEAFPVTEVKLDRSFVQGICHSHAKHLIVDSVIRLGRELGMNVVAEGVETEAERSMLFEMGCAQAQGYLFSRPVPSETFAALARVGSSLGPPLKMPAAANLRALGEDNCNGN